MSVKERKGATQSVRFFSFVQIRFLLKLKNWNVDKKSLKRETTFLKLRNLKNLNLQIDLIWKAEMVFVSN